MAPVLPFALGSLGFLTNFDFNDYKLVMDSAIDHGIRVDLRMRFTCTVYRAIADIETKKRNAVKERITGETLMKDLERGGWEALEGGYPQTVAALGGMRRSSVSRRGQWRHLKCSMISLWIVGHRHLLACSSCSVYAYHLSFHKL